MPNPIPGFPDASTTGVPDSADLTTYTGPMTITTPGTVIDGQIINGSLRVTAEDVTITNSVINYDSWWGIDAEGADGITVQNSTIVGPGSSADSNAGILGSGTFSNNNISNSENGIVLTGGESQVTGNYIHDLQDGGADPHYDGISVQGNQDGVLIQDNTIVGRDTADVFIKDDFGPINDITVDHNLLIGEPGYNVYVDGRADNGAITNVAITDNYVQEGFYGTYSVDQSSPDISGNVEFAKGDAPDVQAPTDPVDPASPPDQTPTDPVDATPPPSDPVDATPPPSDPVDATPPPSDPVDATPPPTGGSSNDGGSGDYGWGFHHGGHGQGQAFDFGSWHDAVASDSAQGSDYAWVSDSSASNDTNQGGFDHYHHAMHGHFADAFTV